MKKFLIIYGMPAAAMKEMMANSTPEEHAKSMESWNSWMEEHSSSFVDPGAPAGKNTRVSSAGTEEVSNEIGGYSIMQAESKEALLEVLQQSPHLAMPGSYTEVMELMPM